MTEASAPSFKGIFSSFHCGRKWESTGPAQHLSTCHGAWVDVNCLIVPCSAPVWKHLHWLCLSTHLFRVFLLDSLIYYCRCFALHGMTKLVRYCDWSAFVYPWCSPCSVQEKRNTVADMRQKNKSLKTLEQWNIFKIFLSKSVITNKGQLYK